MQKIEAPAVLQIRKLDIGDGYYVRATLPNGETDAIYGFGDPLERRIGLIGSRADG